MFIKILTILIKVFRFIWTIARSSLGKIFDTDGSRGIYL
jgi:hypothetical protein